MKTRNQIQLLAVMLYCVVTLWGCSDKVDAPEDNGMVPILFAMQDNWDNADNAPPLSKAGQYTENTLFTNDKGIGITAFYLQDGGESIDYLAPDFMYNEHLSYTGGAWSYSPIKYWPTMSNDKIHFFAYWPYSGDDNRISHHTSNTDVGYPQLSYNSPDANIDILGANIKTSESELTDEKLTLDFKHLLTKVNFAFIQDGYTTTDYHNLVYRVRFNAPTAGTYTFGDGTDGIPGSWTSKTQYRDITRYCGPSGVIIYDDEAITVDRFTCYIMPATLQDFYIVINSEELHYKHTEPIVLEQGKEVTLTFHLQDRGENLFVTTFTIIWDNGETFNGSLM